MTSLLSNQTISANGQVIVQNDGSYTPIGQVVVTAPSNPSAGTTPELDFFVDFSDNQLTWERQRKFPSITAALSAKAGMVFEQCFDGFIRVSWALPDPTAVFPNISVDIYGDNASHDIILSDTSGESGEVDQWL